jgi:hypothetical protein
MEDGKMRSQLTIEPYPHVVISFTLRLVAFAYHLMASSLKPQRFAITPFKIAVQFCEKQKKRLTTTNELYQSFGKSASLFSIIFFIETNIDCIIR